MLLVFSIETAKGPHAPLTKKLRFATFIILGIIILAGVHATSMIFLGLQSQNANF
jgi:hypothetical protein